MCLFFQVVGYGAIDDVEKSEASEQIEVGGLDSDAFPDVGRSHQLAGEFDQ
ncbi:hypothetical protein [Sphingomonas sp. NFX23]|uniref:hypothetical protein n=1 Tax=Sphingomonas sp. NFX23 TaxID=2819532 RepID=UPI003CEE7E77